MLYFARAVAPQRSRTSGKKWSEIRPIAVLEDIAVCGKLGQTIHWRGSSGSNSNRTTVIGDASRQAGSVGQADYQGIASCVSFDHAIQRESNGKWTQRNLTLSSLAN